MWSEASTRSLGSICLLIKVCRSPRRVLRDSRSKSPIPLCRFSLHSMSTSQPQFAFVTLVTSDDYLPGALVVAAALQEVHTSPPIYPDEYDPSDFHRVCLATPETLNVNTMKHLRKAFDVVIGVEVIEEDTEEGLKLLGKQVEPVSTVI